MPALDNAVYTFAASHQAPLLWTVITALGSVLGLAVVTLAAIYAFNGRRNALMLTLALLGSVLTSPGFKIIFARTRPDEATLLTYAFPSGHSFGSAAVYGMIALLLWRNGLRGQALAMLAIPLLVGISRIMLLEHWLTDVIAGWIIGAFLIAVIAYFTRVDTSRARRRSAR